MSRLSHATILGYHRVGSHRQDHVPTVTAEAFERQLDLLVKFRFRVLSLDDVLNRLERGEPAPHRSVVITFDDGYAETHTLAWPLLRKHGFPATVFVTPEEVGLPGFATWEQVIDMSRDAVTIGSHTMHHSYLPDVREAQLSEEVVRSKAVIEERIGRRVDYLSYPVGGYTPQAQAAAREAGYRAAVTTNRGVSRAVDRFALRRVKMTDRDTNPLYLLVKTSGYYDLFRQLKRPA